MNLNDKWIANLGEIGPILSDYEKYLLRRMEMAMEWNPTKLMLPIEGETVIGAHYTGCDRDEWDYHFVTYFRDKEKFFDYSLQEYVHIDFWAEIKEPPNICSVREAEDIIDGRSKRTMRGCIHTVDKAHSDVDGEDVTKRDKNAHE